MRTTLKRGIGRGAELDGNGNGRVVLPPGVLTPMRRYRQPPRTKRSIPARIARGFFWALLVVLMLAAAAAGASYLYGQNVANATAPTGEMKRAAKRPGALAAVSLHKPAIALVIGSDHRALPGWASRSDTVMLLRTDPTTKTVSMLSIPRDLRVDIKCPGKDGTVHDLGGGKINAAYELCGPGGTLETVKALTGLEVNYLINVNFVGFIQLVDKLGGVPIDVDRRYYNKNVHTLATDYASINLQPGYQVLNGRDALDFVRYRHTDSDIYRVARQQMFVRAAKEQIARFSKWKVLQLVKVIRKGKNVQIGRAGGRGVTFGTMWNYASFLYHLPPGHFVQAKIEGLSGMTDLYTDPSNITHAVQEFVNPDVEAPAKATAAALGERYRPKRHGLRPATVTVTVLNGNGRTGSASNGTYLLAQRGYHVLSPPNGATANAPSWTYVRSKAYYDPAQPRSRTAAAQLAMLVGDTDVAPLPPEVEPMANGAMVVIVLGRTFQDKLALPPPSTTTPKHEPAYVTTDPAATRRLLWPVRRRVPFRLELPAVIQRASRPDWEEPIRIYSIAGRKAVRIIYSTGVPGDYWGVEETSWDEAPALAERNIERHLGRRTFDFYYSGTHLHMIVLRANGATYWVVNTLVDSLSNETMVAIAKGLRPL